ncbi:MAG: hypothetical protein NTY48_04130 [Candidatus Diapherotrites archaeon]|nr:hypothetical protein [Candidatus Diapherotrites archaeon]
MNKRNYLVAFSALFLVTFLFGCTTSVSERDALSQLQELQSKYSVVGGFSSSSASLGEYISDITLLRSKTSGSSEKILTAEIFSAQTFYYLNKAMGLSQTISMDKVSCSSKDVKDAITSITLASKYYSNAIDELSSLSQQEASALRPNQLGSIKGLSETITPIKAFFEEKC